MTSEIGSDLALSRPWGMLNNLADDAVEKASFDLDAEHIIPCAVGNRDRGIGAKNETITKPELKYA